MCKKQTSVSHSSTESENISLDASLRMDGTLALDLWDLIVAVLHGNTYQSNQEREDLCTNLVRAKPHQLPMRKKSWKDWWSGQRWFYFFIRPFFSSGSFENLWRQRSSDQDDYKKEEALPWDMFPEPTELLLIGFVTESIWTPSSKSNTLTPKTNSQTNWQREISHVMNGIIFCVCLTQAIFSSTSCSDVMSKRTMKDSGEERVTAKSKPMMNLVSRCSEKILTCLPPVHQKARGKTRFESHLPLSSWTELHLRTGRPVKDAYSSSHSEWNADKNWSSQVWKSSEMLEARTERPVGGQPFTQHTDKFVIDDDDTDSDTATESDLSLKSRSFLHRVDDRLRKILDQSSKDAMQDIDKHSSIWWMFMSSTLKASVFMGKNYSDNWHSIINTGHNLTVSLRNRCLTYLKSW